MKRLDQLTFTRFAAVLLVLLYHGNGNFYTSFVNGGSMLSALMRSAPTAVGYLYVLSGFVMSLVYFRPDEKFDIVTYWRARFIRIYPLYLIAFLLTCYYYLDSILAIKPQKILANIFVLQAWIPAYSQSFNYASWSMTVEFFFYAIFPFFTMWAYRQSTRKLIVLSLVFWTLSQLVYHTLWIGYFPEHRGFIIYFPPFHLNSFIMGVVGGIWYLREGRRQNIKPLTILLVLMGSILLAAGYTIVSTNYYPSLPNDLQPMAGLLAPVFALFIVSLAMDKSRLSTVLERSAPVTLGETSYALYILHVPIAWLFERTLEHSALSNPRFIFDVVFLPMMIVIGLLAHFYIDAPLRGWLKKTMQRISIPLLLLDLAIVSASVYLVFRLRFGEGREYNSYRDMLRLMFWSVFFFRTALSLWTNSLNPANLRLPILQLMRPVFISVTLGSLIVSGIVYAGYGMGWFGNFPRSIFFMDWGIVLVASLLTRFLLRALKVYKPVPVPA